VLRRQPIKKSAGTVIGTVIPARLRGNVKAADGGCVGYLVGMEGPCFGSLELDHVRASHGIGMKSETERGNLVTLCSTHHREKTENGRKYRPLLLEYIAARDRAC
jgi:5-methylcytosine-specific restriction endonuclease McrA